MNKQEFIDFIEVIATLADPNAADLSREDRAELVGLLRALAGFLNRLAVRRLH